MKNKRKTRLPWNEERKTQQAYLLYLQGKTLREAMSLLNINVSVESLEDRLRVRYGADFTKRNCILKVLHEDYLTKPEFKEVLEAWLEENKLRILQLEIEHPVTVYTEDYMQNQTEHECGENDDNLYLIDLRTKELNERC